MQASVPEFTKRILSILGTIETANSAISVSKAVGIPKDVPSMALSITAFTTGSKAWPKIIGPQELM
ncbi:hypothetical protein D9M71_780480 [compost metagenome]